MLEHLTKETFDQKVKGFSSSEDWKFNGTKPMIIKFSASWCGPCKQLTPIIEQLQKEYADKIDFYEVDTDEVPELPVLFNIRGVPTTIFFPIGENYFKKVGAMPIFMIKEIIKEKFKI